MNNEGFVTEEATGQVDFAGSPRRRFSVSLLKWLVPISRFGLAALFLFTAGAKLAILKGFAANVSELLSASGLD